MNSIFLLFILFAAGCNSEGITESSASSINVDSSSATGNAGVTPTNISGCYASNGRKDSALLKLITSGTNVTGELSYHLYEKDNNSGTIKGLVHDNLVVANYTFQAEGMTSIRQVVFKITGDTLVEGFGDIMMKGDTAEFKNISDLQFQTDRPFLKTACR